MAMAMVMVRTNQTIANISTKQTVSLSTSMDVKNLTQVGQTCVQILKPVSENEIRVLLLQVH